MKLDLRQHLPRCDAPLAALSRRWYGRQVPWPLASTTAGRAVLRWQAVQASTAALQVLVLSADGEWLEVQWVDTLPADWPQELSHPALPAVLRNTLLTPLLAPVLEHLLQHTGVVFTLADAQVQVRAWTPDQALGWSLVGEPPAGAAVLRGMVRAGSEVGWAWLQALMPASPPMAWTRDAQRLMLSLHARPLPVQSSDLQGLAPGDVLLFDAGPGTPSRLAARVRLDGRWLPGVRGLYLGHGLQITQTQATDDARWPEVASLQRKFSMSSPAASAAPAPAAVDALPVWVDVELARMSLSIEQLRGLSIGQVFELDAGLNPTQVELKCGGQRLGRAELVMVGERLGVRLVELATPAVAVPLPASESQGVAA
ncbi:MAG: FliM/FliN family flagellar motor switch protein [Pseudomonadota bacterium]